MKKIVLLLAICLALTTQTLFAQVPSYVPTTGLVGYWPFNGNANDESGNGNNGTNNGATITTDRFGNANSAYNFNGSSKINVPHSNTLNVGNEMTISVWFKQNTMENTINYILQKGSGGGCINTGYSLNIDYNFGNIPNGQKLLSYGQNGNCANIGSDIQLNSSWHSMIVVYAPNTGNKLYIDGQLVNGNYSVCSSCNILNSLTPLIIGGFYSTSGGFNWNGLLDDIGIWNRALNQQEITNLYNSANSNECLTMVINTGALSTNPVTYTSTVNIYPNPANDQITIDCGNLANVVGWSIKITNMLGQEVFNQPMNTQQYVVPLNSWTGQGMYFVKISNAQNEVVNIKKIILQ
ncbi:LamG-like jellyroll fold domain-containing protein [Flavobacterium sp.]|uniref:LamG-like jellyroll fold domain-containing protein n=1 Tax=Flavobacterium sp. TaxID=239 RepID=UPI0033402742